MTGANRSSKPKIEIDQDQPLERLSLEVRLEDTGHGGHVTVHFPGANRQAAHAGISTISSLMGGGTGSPCFLRLARYPAIRPGHARRQIEHSVLLAPRGRGLRAPARVLIRAATVRERWRRPVLNTAFGPLAHARGSVARGSDARAARSITAVELCGPVLVTKRPRNRQLSPWSGSEPGVPGTLPGVGETAPCQARLVV